MRSSDCSIKGDLASLETAWLAEYSAGRIKAFCTSADAPSGDTPLQAAAAWQSGLMLAEMCTFCVEFSRYHHFKLMY